MKWRIKKEISLKKLFVELGKFVLKALECMEGDFRRKKIRNESHGQECRGMGRRE